MYKAICVLFICLATLGYGTEPLLPQPQTTKEEAVAFPPNPAELKSDWWSYYKVDPERLIVRVQRTNESLNRLEQEFSQAQLSSGRPLIKQIQVGLQTYLDLQQKKMATSPFRTKNFAGKLLFWAFFKPRSNFNSKQ